MIGSFRWSALLAGVFALVVACTPLDPAATPAPGSPTRSQLESLLTGTTIVAERTRMPGYDRDCAAGHGCVFGPAWADDTDAAAGRNGCDTRDDVLANQLTTVTFREDSHRCVVLTGTLYDPYTGNRIEFARRHASAVQIDHVYPLAAAWAMGAAAWPMERRRRFANDVEYNLLAVDGKANQAKGDRTPGQWLPPDRAYHCYYVGKFLSAARHYRLPITRADRDAVTRVASSCG